MWADRQTKHGGSGKEQCASCVCVSWLTWKKLKCVWARVWFREAAFCAAALPGSSTGPHPRVSGSQTASPVTTGQSSAGCALITIIQGRLITIHRPSAKWRACHCNQPATARLAFSWGGEGGQAWRRTVVTRLVHSHPDNNYPMTVVTLGISQSRLISTDSIGPS